MLGLVRGVRAADSLGTGDAANSFESGIAGEVRHWWREGIEKGCAGLPQGLGRTPSFGLFMQEMNLLPTPESPVTRQEKMATVWDEAEVSAGRRRGVPELGPECETFLKGWKQVAGSPRSASDWAPSLGRGQTTRLHPAVRECGDVGRQLLVRVNKYFFLSLNSKMALGRRCSRCPQRRSSSAHGCWTVRSRWGA